MTTTKPAFELAKKVDKLVVLPRVFNILIDLINHPDPDPKKVHDTLASDVSLAATIMRLSASSLYNFATPPASLLHAITLLGAKPTIAFCLNQTIKLNFEKQSNLDMSLIWLWSMRAGAISKYLFKNNIYYDDRNLIFLASLLHNLGMVVFLTLFDVAYAEALGPQFEGHNTINKFEQEQYGCTHNELGASLLELWGFPAKIVVAIADDASGSRIGDIVKKSNIIARDMNIDYSREPPEIQFGQMATSQISSSLLSVNRVGEQLVSALEDNPL